MSGYVNPFSAHDWEVFLEGSVRYHHEALARIHCDHETLEERVERLLGEDYGFPPPLGNLGRGRRFIESVFELDSLSGRFDPDTSIVGACASPRIIGRRTYYDVNPRCVSQEYLKLPDSCITAMVLARYAGARCDEALFDCDAWPASHMTAAEWRLVERCVDKGGEF